MENDVDPDVLRTTQNTLGKYVKRPPLSEKLLKKPPFRFLHDIISTVLKTTGFFEGLFEPDELISENVKDRESKILFLTKVITVVGLTTGKTLSVKPSKIVAGQEVEKTNLLLQAIAEAIDKKLSSQEAVQKYRESIKSPQAHNVNDDNTASKQKPTTKKPNEATKITSKNSEKFTKTGSEKSLPKAENPATKTDKPTNKTEKLTAKTEKHTVKTEKHTSKTEKPTAKTEKTLNKTEKSSVNKVKLKENTKPAKELIKKPTLNQKDVEIPKTTNDVINADLLNETKPQVNIEQQFILDEPTLKNQKTQDINLKELDNDDNLSNSNQEKHDIDKIDILEESNLNASLSSVDLMQINNLALIEENNRDKHDDDQSEEMSNLNGSTNTFSPLVEGEKDRGSLKSQWSKESKESESNVEYKKENDTFSVSSTILRKDEYKAKNPRPASVRPSSSRPGAPRPRDKNESIINEPESILVGKVNIITESAPNEEDEDSSIVIVDSVSDDQKQEPPESLQLPSSEHGHLVQQILDSQKELKQASNKTEIEWHFGVHKAREAMNLEIEQMRYNIQALSRAANPLGKLLDHIQEDVEIMRQELHQWTLTYEKTAKEVAKQKTINEESLLPLHTKLKQLDIDIEEKYNKINDLKIAIQKNSSRIDKLLATGNVQ